MKKHALKLAATLALSLPAVFGSAASAGTIGAGEATSHGEGDVVHKILTAEDPIYPSGADIAHGMERITGIEDPSASSPAE